MLHDPYTGRIIPFTRGSATSAAVQIDHVVALMDAWQTGAQQLTAAARHGLANDPLNLQATDGPMNEAKGSGDAATWLPPNKEYRCTYVSRQVEVKARYGLWVTPAEKDAMIRILDGCVGMPAAAAVVPPPSKGAATDGGTCRPLSNGGNCYKAGQLCAKRYRGTSGVAGNGQSIMCVERGGQWRWVAA